MADQLFDMRALETEIENALDALAAEAASDFAKTMQTWQVHRTPVVIEKSAGRRVVSVTNEIYYYLNFGTDVRRALLSPGWMSKTSVGVIGSTAGAGHVITAGSQYAFKGIDARKFDEAIVERITAEVLPQVLEHVADNLVSIIVRVL